MMEEVLMYLCTYVHACTRGVAGASEGTSCHFHHITHVLIVATAAAPTAPTQKPVVERLF